MVLPYLNNAQTTLLEDVYTGWSKKASNRHRRQVVCGLCSTQGISQQWKSV